MKLAAAMFLIFTGSGQGRDFCALKVNVRDVHGRPIAADAVLVNDQGSAIVKASTPSSTTEICDFPFGSHTLVVRAFGYLPTKISDIQIHFGEERSITVTLNSSGSGDGGTNACPVELRAVTTANVAVAGAILESDGFKVAADRFGRVNTALLTGRSRSYSIVAAGFEPMQIALECKGAERIQRTITLSAR